MTDDRQEFAANRDAGLRARHETREARAVRRAQIRVVANHLRLSSKTDSNGDGDLTVYADDVDALAAEIVAELIPQETKPRSCQPGCEFIAPHPSHPCGQYTRERP